MRPHILEIFPAEFKRYLIEHDLRSYRLKQLYNWLYALNESDFSKMTTLSKELREKLAEDFDNFLPTVVASSEAEDGTTKYLLELKDNHKIEMVLIPHENKHTLCISSQVGCTRGCKFCATATMGSIRNLEVYEILSQIRIAKKMLGENRLTNLVFMGMGEPLDNLENVLTAIRLLQDDLCYNFSPRRITISTSGVVPKIKELEESGIKLKLAVSLNAAIQAKREELMPIAKQYPLSELIPALKEFSQKTSYRITFEYILIKNFNMLREDVKAIKQLLGNIPCKLNFIKWNPVKGLPYRSPTQNEIEVFLKAMENFDSAITFRKSRGDQIDAACGQLAVLRT